MLIALITLVAATAVPAAWREADSKPVCRTIQLVEDLVTVRTRRICATPAQWVRYREVERARSLRSFPLSGR